jgi:hypothetical protein
MRGSALPDDGRIVGPASQFKRAERWLLANLPTAGKLAASWFVWVLGTFGPAAAVRNGSA